MKFEPCNALRQPARRCLPEGIQRVAGDDSSRFENIVFAGVGNRCFWQAGFWSVAAQTLALKPKRVTAVSAGSAIACTPFSDCFDSDFCHYKKAFAANGSNVYLRNLLRD